MVYITWVCQYNFKTELMKVIKFESEIVDNEINEITKEKALMMTNGRAILTFSEIGY